MIRTKYLFMIMPQIALNVNRIFGKISKAEKYCDVLSYSDTTVKV